MVALINIGNMKEWDACTVVPILLLLLNNMFSCAAWLN